jgi:hypothetical protein
MDDLPLSPLSIFKADLGRPGWSNEDTARQLAALAALGVDWAQTRTIAKNPQIWHETNRLLGEHPSVGKVNNYFAGSMLGHTLLMNALPPEWRKWAQYGTLGLEAGVTGRNKFNLGIGMTF